MLWVYPCEGTAGMSGNVSYLKVGYDKLVKKDQSLFLHIAFFFNDKTVDNVTTMLADSNLDVING